MPEGLRLRTGEGGMHGTVISCVGASRFVLGSLLLSCSPVPDCSSGTTFLRRMERCSLARVHSGSVLYPSRSNLAFTPVTTPLKTPANPEASRRACQFSNRLRVRLTRRGQAKESCYIAVLSTAPKTGSFTHSPKSAVFSIQSVK